MVIDANLELSLAVLCKVYTEFKDLTGGQTVLACSSSTQPRARQGLPVE